jgi:hypothetical protein
MKITRTSPLTGGQTTLDLPVTEEQIQAYQRGGLIQDVFSHLTPGQREFIMSGYTEEDWAKMFGPCKNRKQ